MTRPEYNANMLPPNFTSKIEVDAFECWRWTAAISGGGYGYIRHEGKWQLAHRAVYRLLVGPIPDDRPHLDHLCLVKSCVNPEHLDAVTALENTRRYLATASPRTHCVRGHAYTEATVVMRRNGKGYLVRSCRLCERERAASYKGVRVFD